MDHRGRACRDGAAAGDARPFRGWLAVLNTRRRSSSRPAAALCIPLAQWFRYGETYSIQAEVALFHFRPLLPVRLRPLPPVPGSSVGTQNGEHTACGDDREAGRGASRLVLWRAVAPTGGAPHRVTLNLFVDVGDPSLGDLVVESGVHRDLPMP